mgnify:FL=1
MKVQLPEKNAIKKKELILYISIMIICIICVIVAFYVQFYARIDFGRLVGIAREQELGQKTEEQTDALETEFDQIFTNSLTDLEGQGENKKADDSKELVYVDMEIKETKLNSYDLEVHIPKINIDSPIIDEYNEDIQSFIDKTNEVLESENQNIIYTVDYVANIQDGILSLMIRSNLKEGSNAQRVIIETYNYDLRNNKEISLEEVLSIEYLEENDVQNRIDTKIAQEQRQVEDLKELGYNIYNRDTSSEQYKVENSKYFYLTDNVLYIIYPYGNENFTSEMDLVII